jgi:hypothetical protein
VIPKEEDSISPGSGIIKHRDRFTSTGRTKNSITASPDRVVLGDVPRHWFDLKSRMLSFIFSSTLNLSYQLASPAWQPSLQAYLTNSPKSHVSTKPLVIETLDGVRIDRSLVTCKE